MNKQTLKSIRWRYRLQFIFVVCSIVIVFVYVSQTIFKKQSMQVKDTTQIDTKMGQLTGSNKQNKKIKSSNLYFKNGEIISYDIDTTKHKVMFGLVSDFKNQKINMYVTDSNAVQIEPTIEQDIDVTTMQFEKAYERVIIHIDIVNGTDDKLLESKTLEVGV